MQCEIAQSVADGHYALFTVLANSPVWEQREDWSSSRQANLEWTISLEVIQ